MKKWIAFIIVCAMVFSLAPNMVTKAAGVTWKISKNNRCILDKVFAVSADTGGIIFGYYKGKVAFLDACTGKLIKTTGFTEINEIKKIGNNIDAIVGKYVKGKLYFGLIDKSGKTLIAADKYTEIYYMNNGFRAVDSNLKSFYITRTGKVLYAYESGDSVKEYENFFVVTNPTYAQETGTNADPNSIEIKGVYDYNGKKLTVVPEADKTAENQYWILYNSVIKDIIESSENDVKENTSKEYPEQLVISSGISMKGNCYIVRAYGLKTDTNNIIGEKYYLYDLSGNLLGKADNLLGYMNDNSYVVCRNYSNDTHDSFSSAVLINLKTYTKVEIIDLKNTEGYQMWRFGDYSLVATPDLDDEGLGAPSLYDVSGKFIKKFKISYFCGDYLYADGCYYNKEMEKIKIDGKLYRVGDGYIIFKDMSKNKFRWTFTDLSLKIVTKTELNYSIFKEYEILETSMEQSSTRIKYKILKNRTGVYLKTPNVSGKTWEYVIDKGGKTVYSYGDSNSDTNVFVRSSGTTNYIASTKMAQAITPGDSKIISAKNSGTGEATVTWEPVKGVTGYQIEYSYTIGTSLQYVKTKATSKTLTGLEEGKTYFIRVRAYISDGEFIKYGHYSQYKSVAIAV